jgi:Spore cortex protein YabQ (Spore_YabQ).
MNLPPVGVEIFILAVLFGVLLGAIYDLFRIVRFAFDFGKTAIFIQDIIFFAACGVLTFLFMLTFTSGQIRAFVFVAQLVGFSAYYFTVGRIVYGLAKKIISIVKRILTAIFAPILKILGKTQKITKKHLTKLYYLLYNRARHLKQKKKTNRTEKNASKSKKAKVKKKAPHRGAG